jgi:hypothetical protein
MQICHLLSLADVAAAITLKPGKLQNLNDESVEKINFIPLLV